jgi:[acyl-carrier-protein] S-malonyltransferase
MDYFEALALVAERGRAMAEAADLEPSGMAALIGAEEDQAELVAAARRNDGGRLWVANINAPGQIVVAGAAADIEWIVAEARALGIRRAIPLKVAGAFHSPLMATAASRLSESAAGVTVSGQRFPVWANVTAAPYDGDIAGTLVAQLTGPVRFAESLRSMASHGVDAFVHVGPGDVTAGLVKRSVEGTDPVVVSSIDAIDEAVARLSV